MLSHQIKKSPIGPLDIVARDGKLLGIWMEGQKYFYQGLKETPCEGTGDPALALAAEWLDRYFAGDRPAIPTGILAPQGSEFRRLIWSLLCEIPYGEVVTYGDLAVKAASLLGKERMSAQAVGGAVGHNPLSVLVPCHRVVGSDGSLTGYAGGIERKILLLRHEGLDMNRFFVPSRGTAL